MTNPVRMFETGCRWYRGDQPCWPHKENSEIACLCEQYEPQGSRWLIINLGAMGDVLRSTAILHGILQADPSAEITWITNYPDLIPVPKPVLRVIKPSDAARLMLMLRTERFDIAVNVDKDPLAASILTEVQAVRKRGFAMNGGTGKIYAVNTGAKDKLATGVDDQASRENAKSYVQELYEIAELGFTERFEYYPPKFDHLPQWAGVDIQYGSWHLGPPKSPYIVLAPGCGDRWPTRKWGLDNWVNLVRALQVQIREPGTIFLVGGDQDLTLLKDIERASSGEPAGGYPRMQVRIVPAIKSMPHLFRFLAEVDVVVTPVSFMLHAALAAKKPRVVVLNSIFNKREFEMYDRGIIIEPDIPCSCYFASKCDRLCITSIRSEVVAGVVVRYARHEAMS